MHAVYAGSGASVVVIVEPGRVPTSGVGRVARLTAAALATARTACSDAGLDVQLAGPGPRPAWAATLPWIALPPLGSGSGATARWHAALAGPIARHAPALVHVLSGFPVPWLAAPYVFTVHDLDVLANPEIHPFAKRTYFRLALPATLTRATRIVAVSRNTAAAITRRWPSLAARTTTVRNALAPNLRQVSAPRELDELRARLELPRRFVLLFAARGPRLRAELAIEATARVAARRAGLELVIAGSSAAARTPRQRRERRGVLAVTRIGTVAESDLPALLSAASVLVHPSREDGFGYPPLEALACGTPVVVSDLAVTRELLGPHAIRVASDESAQWADAIESALDDGRRRDTLARLAPYWRSRFDVGRLGTRLVHVYRSTLAAMRRDGQQLTATNAPPPGDVVDEVRPRGPDRAQIHS